MRKLLALLMLSSTIALTACAMNPQAQAYWRAPERDDLNQQKDYIECQALAGQAAVGAGGWTSVAPVQAAIFDQAKQTYFAQCLESRGYQWVIPR